MYVMPFIEMGSGYHLSGGKVFANNFIAFALALLNVVFVEESRVPEKRSRDTLED